MHVIQYKYTNRVSRSYLILFNPIFFGKILFCPIFWEMSYFIQFLAILPLILLF